MLEDMKDKKKEKMCEVKGREKKIDECGGFCFKDSIYWWNI